MSTSHLAILGSVVNLCTKNSTSGIRRIRRWQSTYWNVVHPSRADDKEPQLVDYRTGGSLRRCPICLGWVAQVARGGGTGRVCYATAGPPVWLGFEECPLNLALYIYFGYWQNKIKLAQGVGCLMQAINIHSCIYLQARMCVFFCVCVCVAVGEWEAFPGYLVAFLIGRA